MNKIIIIVILLFGGLALWASTPADKEVPENINKQLSKYDLLLYTIDSNPEQTKLKAVEEYKTYPPLHPERFRRKVKMLWGIDLNDYPDNAIISVGGYFTSFIITLSKNYQLMHGFVPDSYDGPYTPPEYHENNVYSHLRAYTFTNDPKAKEELLKYTKRMKDKYFDGHKVQWIDQDKNEGDEGVEGADFFVMLYHNALFGSNAELMKYNTELNSPIGLLPIGPYKMPGRVPDIRLDMLSQYLKKELAKGRKFKKHEYYGEEDQIWLGFNPYDSIAAAQSPFGSLCDYPVVSPNLTLEEGSSFSYRPWHNYSAERGMCSFMSFVLQLKGKYLNKSVIKFMSGQMDKNIGIDGLFGQIQNNIRSNNYYGYSVLRDFCENPMREMPTLEKIGTNFTAKVKEANTLLLLEPFADSYDIDTIQSSETFKAYEMGHDDYYFIEIIKPIESPVADQYGYAMILDRTETVYGYLPKIKLRAYTSQDILKEEYTDLAKSKRGVINDKDGYVNIRKAPNTQSEIAGKIEDKEIFHYWETSDNWYIVQTKDGLRGYVYKDRIREKYDTGGWTIDE